MKIKNIFAREIFNSQAIPTVLCEIELEDGTIVSAAVPSGNSISSHEAVELRDGGTRLAGLGVTKAVQYIENIVAQHLKDKEPDIIEMDAFLVELDGTRNKSKLGSNTILAVSCAVLKAQAHIYGIELYTMLASLLGLGSVSLPVPLFNMISGGIHTDNMVHIQEIMIIPLESRNFRECMEAAVLLTYYMKDLLQEKGLRICTSIEGAFAPKFQDDYDALDTLMMAIDRVNEDHGINYALALDIAANQLFDQKKHAYAWYDEFLEPHQMIGLYAQLCSEYPIYFIEDGLHEDDWDGWRMMREQLDSQVRIVADDLCATNPERIHKAITSNIAHGTIIKPNQIGTITETLQAIQLAQDHKIQTIISHRSGETNDSLIADLAVGVSADHIKAGGCAHGERMAKYNRLLTIEDQLITNILIES